MAVKKLDEIYARLLPGKPIHPFDPINDTTFYAFPVDKQQESVRRLLAQTRVLAIGNEMGSRNVERIFCPTPMSGDLTAYQLLLKKKVEGNTAGLDIDKNGWLTAQDPQHQLAYDELRHKVVLPAHVASHWKGDKLERSFPDKGVMVVSDVEGPIRQTRQDHALSGGAYWQGPIYENYWVPTVWRSHGLALNTAHAVSRHANAEEIAADFIQCGFLDAHRKDLTPGRKYDVTDAEGKHVTLADRAWESAKHVIDVVEKGFKTDFAVNALIARFQIHDWLQDSANSPLDMARVHPVLKNRTPEDVGRMERLKAVMLPYLADKCLEWFPKEGEKYRKEYVERELEPIRGSLDKSSIPALRDEVMSYRPRGGTNVFLHEQYNFTQPVPANDDSLSHNFAAVTRKVKRRGTDGAHFDDSAQMFDDKAMLFKGLDTWEQAAIGFMAGAMEGTRAPENKPGVWAYSCHPKGGEIAESFMEKHGILYLREAQGHPDYSHDVIQKNAKKDAKLQDGILDEPQAKARGVGTLLSTLHFLDYANVAEQNREFVAAKGKTRLSADAVLALQMEWFDRNATGLVLHKGWQFHHGEVAMVMRAVQHVVGVGPRDAMDGGQHRCELMSYDPKAEEGQRLKKQSLHDLITSLGTYMEKCAAQETPVPYREGYVALARLLEISDKLSTPKLNLQPVKDVKTGAVSTHEIIDWSKVDTGFHGFWYNDPAKKADLMATPAGAKQSSMRDRLRTMILEKGISYFNPGDLDGLHDDYRKKWQEVKGVTNEQGRTNKLQMQTLHLDHGSTS